MAVETLKCNCHQNPSKIWISRQKSKNQFFFSFRPQIALRLLGRCETWCSFLSSKRFKFEKIEENDFRLDSHQNGRMQRLKISNLNLPVICLCVYWRIKTYRYFFFKDKVFSYPKQVRTWLECHLTLNTQFRKKPFQLLCRISNLRIKFRDISRHVP